MEEKHACQRPGQLLGEHFLMKKYIVKERQIPVNMLLHELFGDKFIDLGLELLVNIAVGLAIPVQIRVQKSLAPVIQRVVILKIHDQRQGQPGSHMIPHRINVVFIQTGDVQVPLHALLIPAEIFPLTEAAPHEAADDGPQKGLRRKLVIQARQQPDHGPVIVAALLGQGAKLHGHLLVHQPFLQCPKENAHFQPRQFFQKLRFFFQQKKSLRQQQGAGTAVGDLLPDILDHPGRACLSVLRHLQKDPQILPTFPIPVMKVRDKAAGFFTLFFRSVLLAEPRMGRRQQRLLHPFGILGYPGQNPGGLLPVSRQIQEKRLQKRICRPQFSACCQPVHAFLHLLQHMLFGGFAGAVIQPLPCHGQPKSRERSSLCPGFLVLFVLRLSCLYRKGKLLGLGANGDGTAV